MALFPDFFLITFYPIFLHLNHIYLTRILHIVLIETNISSKMLDMNNRQTYAKRYTFWEIPHKQS